MIENKKQNAIRIFAPTAEDVRISRNRVHEIVRKTARQHHLFTRADLQTMLESAARSEKKEQKKKESIKTNMAGL